MSTRMKALKSAMAPATSSTVTLPERPKRHVLTSSVPRTKVLPRAELVTPEAADQVVHFGFVGDQHLAGDAESAGLSKQH